MKQIVPKRRFAYIREQIRDGRLTAASVLAVDDELNGYATAVVVLANQPVLKPRSVSKILKMYAPDSAGV